VKIVVDNIKIFIKLLRIQSRLCRTCTQMEAHKL